MYISPLWRPPWPDRNILHLEKKTQKQPKTPKPQNPLIIILSFSKMSYWLLFIYQETFLTKDSNTMTTNFQRQENLILDKNLKKVDLLTQKEPVVAGMSQIQGVNVI